MGSSWNRWVKLVFPDVNMLMHVNVNVPEKEWSHALKAKFRKHGTEPSKHVDGQFLTMSCAYLRGGTVCEPAPSAHIQLAPGEIGIWKGKICKKRDRFIDDSDNEGRPLVYSIPLDPNDSSRFVSLIDEYDDELPEKLAILQSLVPWEPTTE